MLNHQLLDANANVTAEHNRLYYHFSFVWNRVVKDGRICTNERMAALYPVIREIYDEILEMEDFWEAQNEK